MTLQTKKLRIKKELRGVIETLLKNTYFPESIFPEGSIFRTEEKKQADFYKTPLNEFKKTKGTIAQLDDENEIWVTVELTAGLREEILQVVFMRRTAKGPIPFLFFQSHYDEIEKIKETDLYKMCEEVQA